MHTPLDDACIRLRHAHAYKTAQNHAPCSIGLVAKSPLPPAVNRRECPDTDENSAPARSIHRASSSYAGSSLATRGSSCLAIRLLQTAKSSAFRLRSASLPWLVSLDAWPVNPPGPRSMRKLRVGGWMCGCERACGSGGCMHARALVYGWWAGCRIVITVGRNTRQKTHNTCEYCM